MSLRPHRSAPTVVLAAVGVLLAGCVPMTPAGQPADQIPSDETPWWAAPPTRSTAGASVTQLLTLASVPLAGTTWDPLFADGPLLQEGQCDDPAKPHSSIDGWGTAATRIGMFDGPSPLPAITDLLSPIGFDPVDAAPNSSGIVTFVSNTAVGLELHVRLVPKDGATWVSLVAGSPCYAI